MGIPDEPFWVPSELLDAYRRHAGGRGAAAHRDGTSATPPRLASAEWIAAWNATGDRRLGRRPADVRSWREDRHPQGDPGRPSRHRGRHPGPGRRRCRPHRQHRHQAEAPDRPVRRRTPADARCTTASANTAWAPPWSAWRCTAASSRSAARSSSSSTTCDRPCASRRCRAPRCVSSSRTTRSASARTVPPISRSSSSRRSGRFRTCT